MKLEVLIRRLSLALMLLLCLSVVAAAQTTGVGSIVGTIKDSTGAVIPGVAVSLTSAGTIGGNQQVVTDESGTYRFTRLVAGIYGVKAELPGFRTVIRDSIHVDADAASRIDLVLEVGTVSDVVNVSSEAVLLDTTTSLHQAVLDKSLIDSLALRTDMEHCKDGSGAGHQQVRYCGRRSVQSVDYHGPRRQSNGRRRFHHGWVRVWLRA